LSKEESSTTVHLLAQLPLVQSVCDNGGQGTPVAADSVSGLAFINLAQAVVTVVNRLKSGS